MKLYCLVCLVYLHTGEDSYFVTETEFSPYWPSDFSIAGYMIIDCILYFIELLLCNYSNLQVTSYKLQ